MRPVKFMLKLNWYPSWCDVWGKLDVSDGVIRVLEVFTESAFFFSSLFSCVTETFREVSFVSSVNQIMNFGYIW